MYSRKEESLVQQLYSISLLSTNAAPFREEVVAVLELHVSGKVERVALQFSDGDGRMLEVIQQHLDLGHNVV